MTRVCQRCGTALHAGATDRAKYCSARCRMAASRAARAAGGRPSLALVGAGAAAEPAPDEPAPSVEVSEDRIVELRDQLRIIKAAQLRCPPDRLAPLAKEYRETLRELAALTAAQEQEAISAARRAGRRSFDASAV